MSDPGRESPTHRLDIPSANPSLTVVAPAPMAGASIVVSPGDKILIGREGALAMESIGLSRQHAWIEFDGKTLVITDAGSTNGTTVNGRPIEGPTALVDADSVGLGELRAIVAIAPQDAAPVEPPVDTAGIGETGGSCVGDHPQTLCGGSDQPRASATT